MSTRLRPFRFGNYSFVSYWFRVVDLFSGSRADFFIYLLLVLNCGKSVTLIYWDRTRPVNKPKSKPGKIESDEIGFSFLFSYFVVVGVDLEIDGINLVR